MGRTLKNLNLKSLSQQTSPWIRFVTIRVLFQTAGSRNIRTRDTWQFRKWYFSTILWINLDAYRPSSPFQRKTIPILKWVWPILHSSTLRHNRWWKWSYKPSRPTKVNVLLNSISNKNGYSSNLTSELVWSRESEFEYVLLRSHHSYHTNNILAF